MKKATLPIARLAIALMALTGLALLQSFGRTKPHSVALTWHPPISAKGPQITSYNVYRSATSGSCYVKIESGVRKPTYTDKHVNSRATYFYVVTAVDDSGHESKYSNEAIAKIP